MERSEEEYENKIKVTLREKDKRHDIKQEVKERRIVDEFKTSNKYEESMGNDNKINKERDFKVV